MWIIQSFFASAELIILRYWSHSHFINSPTHHTLNMRCKAILKPSRAAKVIQSVFINQKMHIPVTFFISSVEHTTSLKIRQRQITCSGSVKASCNLIMSTQSYERLNIWKWADSTNLFLIFLSDFFSDGYFIRGNGQSPSVKNCSCATAIWIQVYWTKLTFFRINQEIVLADQSFRLQ